MERTRPPFSLSMALPLLPWLLLTGLAATASAVSVSRRAAEGGSIGDLCKMKDGAAGTCRSFVQCDAASEALKKGQSLVICSYEEFTPIVCCPLATSTAGSTAAKMCTKYGDAVYVYVKSPVLVNPPQYSKKNTCAMRGVPFVVGGEEASPNEFPHMALLGYKSRQDPKWLCGGSLISERYVLTAAHCLQTGEGFPVVVRLGELNLKNDHELNNQHVDYGVQDRIAHPKYKSGAHYNDVALLRLERDVNFTRSIRPACLNALAEIPDQNATATGWGHLEWADNEISDKLMKVKLPLQSSEECLRAYRTPTPRLKQGYHKESMLCAGDLAGGKDTCQGDSGGPLQTKLGNPYCMYNIIGITNIGMRCGAKNSPAVYARISYFLPWIESIVWPS